MTSDSREHPESFRGSSRQLAANISAIPTGVEESLSVSAFPAL